MNYSHLDTEVATSRYMMAAGWLQNVDHIVEIGGASSPINLFLPPNYATCNVVDPTIEEGAYGMEGADIRHHAVFFQEFDFQYNVFDRMESGDTIGVVMMGLELQYENDDIHLLDPLVGAADVLIIDHVVENLDAARQSFIFEEWARNDYRFKAVELTMKFEYDCDYWDGEEIVPSFHKQRRFVVYHSHYYRERW